MPKKEIPRERIAKVLEMFAQCEHTMTEIAHDTKIKTWKVSTLVSEHFFYKKESELTEIITLKSKV